MRTGHSGPSERACDDRKDLGASGCGLIGWNVTDSKAILSQYVPQLRSLQNTKVAVYGFTDNLPLAPALKRIGVSNDIDLVAASRQRWRVFPFARNQPQYPALRQIHAAIAKNKPPGYSAWISR